MLAAPVSAIAYTVSVRTDARTYVGASTIHISGQVSPAPGPGTYVALRILNPNKAVVTADEVQVNGTTGSYTDAIIAGGSSGWVGGNYVVNATWGAYGPAIFSTANFAWSNLMTTTTTTTTSSTTSSNTSSTSTSSTTSSTSTTSTTSTTSAIPSSTSSSSSTTTTVSSSTSSSSGGGIPEFPYQVLAVTVFTLLVLASYLAVRRTQRPRNLSP
jgi:hypothetical protein